MLTVAVDARAEHLVIVLGARQQFGADLGEARFQHAAGGLQVLDGQVDFDLLGLQFGNPLAELGQGGGGLSRKSG